MTETTQITVTLDENLRQVLQQLKEARHTKNTSQLIREALYEYQNFFAKGYHNCNNPAAVATVPQQPANEQPAPRQVCLERVAVVTLGLESDLAPLEGIESRLTAAGWKGLRWQSGTLFGRHPDYKEIELPLGAQVER